MSDEHPLNFWDEVSEFWILEFQVSRFLECLRTQVSGAKEQREPGAPRTMNAVNECKSRCLANKGHPRRFTNDPSAVLKIDEFSSSDCGNIVNPYGQEANS